MRVTRAGPTTLRTVKGTLESRHSRALAAARRSRRSLRDPPRRL